MPEKRDSKRYIKRLRLRFGTGDPVRIGFTQDISERGLFILTTHVYAPATKLNIEITLSDNGTIRAQGMVMWVKMIPPSLIHVVKKHGMGIRITKIISGEDRYHELIPHEGLLRPLTTASLTSSS